MKIIVGLGNPTSKYEGTRHNIGFAVIDALAAKYNIRVNTNKHKALVGSGIIGGEKVILAKPQTYMNLSGESVRPLVDFYKVDPEDLLIIYDDISLDPGNIRARASGSAGGHNGMKSLILHLGTDLFPRLRLGVGEKPAKMDLADYVLGHFSAEEKPLMADGVKLAVEAVEVFVSDGIKEAMNRYNGLKKKEKAEGELSKAEKRRLAKMGKKTEVSDVESTTKLVENENTNPNMPEQQATTESAESATTESVESTTTESVESTATEPAAHV